MNRTQLAAQTVKYFRSSQRILLRGSKPVANFFRRHQKAVLAGAVASTPAGMLALAGYGTYRLTERAARPDRGMPSVIVRIGAAALLATWTSTQIIGHFYLDRQSAYEDAVRTAAQEIARGKDRAQKEVSYETDSLITFMPVTDKASVDLRLAYSSQTQKCFGAYDALQPLSWPRGAVRQKPTVMQFCSGSEHPAGFESATLITAQP